MRRLPVRGVLDISRYTRLPLVKQGADAKSSWRFSSESGDEYVMSPYSDSSWMCAAAGEYTKKSLMDSPVSREHRARESECKRTVGDSPKAASSSGVARVPERSRWGRDGKASTNGM